MAVTATHLTTGGSAVDNTSFATASITPSSNKLVLVGLRYRRAVGTPPTTPSLSGNSMTWVEVATITSSGATQKVSIFRSMALAPTTGAITMSFSETQDNCLWSVAEFTNASTNGTFGSGAIRQSASNEVSGTNTGITVTLAAFANTLNATYGVVGTGPNIAITEGSGFSELGEAAAAAEGSIESEFKGTNDTSVDWTWASTAITGLAIAVEINEASTKSGFLAFM